MVTQLNEFKEEEKLLKKLGPKKVNKIFNIAVIIFIAFSEDDSNFSFSINFLFSNFLLN